MKISGVLWLITASLFESFSLLHAQTLDQSNDSIVQVTAEAEGLTPVDPFALPGFASCWWTVYPGTGPLPMPCPPQDLSVPIYEIASGIYLVDATGGAVSLNNSQSSVTAAAVAAAVERQGNAIADLIEQVQETEFEQTMAMSFGMEVPTPGEGGGEGGGTNSYGAGFSLPDYGTNLWIAHVTLTNGALATIASNTLPLVLYEVQTNASLLTTNWGTLTAFPFFYGSETTNWTPLDALPVMITQAHVFFRLKSWADDGSGLPIWWQLQYFGTNGVDPYGNPAGDGWSNLQKFQNGWNPNQFYTPATPQVAAIFNKNTSYATVSWLPSPGAVTNYLVQKHHGITGITTSLNFSPDTFSLADDLSTDVGLATPQIYADYSVQAQYAGGNSDWGTVSIHNGDNPSAFIVPGPQGKLALLLQNLPGDLSSVRIYRELTGAIGTPTVSDYLETDFIQNLSPALATGYFEIAASGITNGICQFSDAQVSAFFQYSFWVQTVRSNGVASSWANVNGWLNNTRFVDARRQLKDNLQFVLRAGSPFDSFEFGIASAESQYWWEVSNFSWSTNYVASGFYYSSELDAPVFDELRPVHANVFLKNFVFDDSHLTDDGLTDTGYYQNNDIAFAPNLLITNYPAYYFDLLGFLTSTNPTVPASQLDISETEWISFDNWAPYTIPNGKKNCYGLSVISEKAAYVTNNSLVVATYYPGDTAPSGVSGGTYLKMAQPIFQLVNYYFANPYADPIPETNGFATTNITKFMVQGVGSGQQIAGYAKFSLANGYTNKFAYLGQYFEQAYKMTNGLATTNATGILSPYGDFFATEPGPVALVTMPDIDTGERGTCAVYCVSLQLDKNNDGTMDLLFNGADATSLGNPTTIWANNNYDRGHTVDGNDFEQDDLSLAQITNLKVPAEQKVPDCQYKTNGLPAIPSTRDLEDYFRLWTPGLTAAMSAMPTNYTVQLLLYGDATIRVFRAVEADGGTNYLFDAITASNQVASSTSLYVGLLTDDSPITLSGGGEHFIFCGAQRGTAELHLQILDANQNVVADTTAYFQIKDIKEMYERFTVGEKPIQTSTAAPMTVATNATDGLPYATPAFQYALPQDTNTPYILFVHGWNMETWEKDRYAEVVFKRLYWQGYHGRFGFYRWPTGNKFSGIISALTDARNYDNSEFTAWRSAVGLTNLLTKLDAEYPGNVYMIAHSMGNVVAGEALRLAGSQLVNTYVAMQGAVPAHAYDPAATNRAIIAVAGIGGDDDTPNRYAEYYTNGAPCYFANSAGAGTYVNVYNATDYALAANLWQVDQNLKPDGGLSLPYPGYYFDSSSGFYKITGTGTDSTHYLNFPINTYEIFAYCDEARCYAIGAQADVGGTFTKAKQVDSQTLWPADTHPHLPGILYSAHVWHSAEFRSDNMGRAAFWNTVLNRMNLSP